MKNIAILGTVGIPASYGGFETLAENLATYHYSKQLPGNLVVYCSGKKKRSSPNYFLDTELRYIPLKANGVSSVLYDILSLFSAMRCRTDVYLLLGVSGALALPFLRLLARGRIVTNIDGIEWRRQKWKGLACWFLRFSEYLAIRFSHDIIADNAGIAEYVMERYGYKCHVIAYGGDHALVSYDKIVPYDTLQGKYALALCRIEPENNVSIVLEAFTRCNEMPLIFIGNWNNSEYGRKLKRQYSSTPNLQLLDSIYDVGVLYSIRQNASIYIHGHSAGGTNPSLVEMMHFGIPILAYDCNFNRHTTDGKAMWFCDVESLQSHLIEINLDDMIQVGVEMKRIAQERYTWDAIGHAYFEILMEQEKY